MKNIMRTLVVTLSFFYASAVAQVSTADSTRDDSGFDRFRRQANEEFNQFRTQAQDDFNQFLAEAWTEYQCFIGESGMYSDPKPSQLASIKTNAGTASTLAPHFQVTTIPMERRREMEAPIPSSPEMLSIRFYGRELRFHLPDALRITAKSAKESDVAQYYKAMSRRFESKILHHELVLTMRRLGLNPWGYYLLLRSIAETAFSTNNDRVLFCFYMLHSNGYMARVGRGQQSGQLMLLLAIDNKKEVYSLPFFRIDSVRYYAVYGGNWGEDTYSYREKADGDSLRQIGLDFKNTLDVASCDKERTVRLSQAGLDIHIPFSTSNLRYYDDIPLTEFPVYFKSAMGKETQDALDTTFIRLFATLEKPQKVALILDFVQNAFAYKVDEEQFGREKYFFPEEVVGYPYSDCEDRCALFASLVRRYMGCDVIGILYPDHLATAVCLDGLVTHGKTVSHMGKTYLLCDPTFPGASIGSLPPEYQDKPFEVVAIQ